MKEKRQTEEDFTLIRAFQQGHDRSFEDLVRRYQRQVGNIIYLTLGGREEIQDLTQEVFIRVHKALPKFEFDSSFFSWVYRITMNLCIDEIRRRKIKRVLSLEFLTEGTLEKEKKSKEIVTAADDVLADEKRSVILSALQELSTEQRQIVIMREYEDLSYNEIAEILGISLQAVKSRLFRAREELRQLLTEYFKERV
ncbi:MAG: sigma-70 family RNA polymerase sigma factor [Bacteroidota bacterium]